MPVSEHSSSGAWYTLRRTLPPFRFDELLAEMVEQLPRYRVDEVLVIVDTEELCHGHATPETASEAAGKLVRLRDALGEVGIVYSLNPWVTRGHEARCRGALQGMQTIVHADGTNDSHIACPLCPVWRKNLANTWGVYAGTKPRTLWIEDDIRDWGAHECFCPLHLERFSKITGSPVTREGIVAALFQPGEPHPWRGRILRMRHEATQEGLRGIAAAVAAVAPEISIGFMSSGPRNHCREGRDWMQCAESIGATPDRPILSRPTMGNYWEWSPPRGLYFSQDSIKLTRHVLPANTVDHTELESVPFSRYSKSVAFTFAQLAVSFAYGARGSTLNIFDHLGTPMQAEPHYGKMLGERKEFLNALAQQAQQPGTFRGVQLHYRKDSARFMHLAPGEGSSALAGEGYQGMEAFEAAGIPTTYDDSGVVFLCGQQPRTLSDDEIRGLLAKGLFVDGPAAAILCERGFATDLGLNSATAAMPLAHYGIVSGEALEHPDFGGAPWQHMTAYLPQVDYNARLSRLEPVANAVTISHFFDADLRPVVPAMTAFENARGGRVVVHAWDYASAIGPMGVSYHGPIRKRQLHAAVRWLFRGEVPLLVSGDGAWPLALRKDCADGTLILLINLSLDPWPGAGFELSLSGPVEAPVVLDSDGSWKPTPDAIWLGGKLVVNRPIALEKPLAIWIAHQKPY